MYDLSQLDWPALGVWVFLLVAGTSLFTFAAGFGCGLYVGDVFQRWVLRGPR